MGYMWQGVVVAISWQICNVKIVANSRYVCQGTNEIIKQNCEFKFYYNKTDVTPTVLEGGNKIILANWPDDKHINLHY